MATEATISLSLPEDIVNAAREAAVLQDRPLDDLVASALDRYIKIQGSLREMLREGQTYGRQIGITCEQDVERVANGEIPLEQLRRSA